MKPSTLLLAGSLAVNVFFAAVFFAGRSAARSAPGSQSAAPASASQPQGDAQLPGPETWDTLQPDVPAQMLERLRAEGFPPAMIRAIVAEQIRVQFAPRRAALNQAAGSQPFWMPLTPDPKTAAALSQIMREQNQAVKDLLGDAPNDNGNAARLRRQLPNFPEEKIAEIERIQQETVRRRDEIYARVEGIGGTSTDDRTLLSSLEKTEREKIIQLLTLQEFADYELRTSNTANNLRNQLGGFSPTEDEFRAIFRLQRAFDEQYQFSPFIDLPPDQMRQMMAGRAEAQRQLTQGLQAALGDARFADYQRSTDSSFQQTSRLVARLELPPESTTQVYAVQKEMQERLRDLQTNRALPADDRAAQLAALAAEAESRIGAVLGPRGYEAYKQYGGTWLQQLQPRATPAPRPVGGGMGGRGGGGGIGGG
jgi:hypothetical protein